MCDGIEVWKEPLLKQKVAGRFILYYSLKLPFDLPRTLVRGYKRISYISLKILKILIFLF